MSAKDLPIEGMQDLIRRGKEAGSLTYDDIGKALQGNDLTPEQIDAIYEQLQDLGIEVMSGNEPTDGKSSDEA